ncbi:rod shape-determining protein MreD [bacterium LRH843]|nr:rod shape-determining protein MreD [bacterium LRH843]
MSRVYIPAAVFILLVIEGTLFQLLTPPQNVDLILVPRFLVVMIVLIGIHFGRVSSVTYGLIFGLLYDVVYTQLLGVYMFGFAFIGYVFAYHHKRIQDSILIQLLITSFAVIFFDYYQFGLYRLIGITDMSAELFLSVRLFPSILLNSSFMIIIYYPVKTLFDYVKKQENLRDR